MLSLDKPYEQTLLASVELAKYLNVNFFHKPIGWAGANREGAAYAFKRAYALLRVYAKPVRPASARKIWFCVLAFVFGHYIYIFAFKLIRWARANREGAVYAFKRAYALLRVYAKPVRPASAQKIWFCVLAFVLDPLIIYVFTHLYSNQLDGQELTAKARLMPSRELMLC
ncbi:hypothetical protein BD560DRAFT_421661 [Blakeslea trispora]|nr:hypothetical protein BD560DRAFT_421661 [Blakeslea trispora]